MSLPYMDLLIEQTNFRCTFSFTSEEMHVRCPNTFYMNYYSACTVSRYGYDCRHKCSINCGVPERCDRVTGQFERGCQVGWSLPTCHQSNYLFNETAIEEEN